MWLYKSEIVNKHGKKKKKKLYLSDAVISEIKIKYLYVQHRLT